MKKAKFKQSITAKEVTKKRYLKLDKNGKPVETVEELLWRVAQHMAKPEIIWSDDVEVKKMSELFYERMLRKKFVCSGKAMHEAGNEETAGQLAACFVLPIEDSIEVIFKTLGEAAVIHKNNGGTGFNFSAIRPHGDKVKNVIGAASGPVDFIKAFSAALSKILQGLKRQGGNMAILNVDHSDIEEFIKMKAEDGNLKNFNVSVGVSDEFMKAVRLKKPWSLINPRTQEVVKKIRADKLFDLICTQAYESGDPGVAFLDRMEKDNPTPSLGKIEATNPCGEIPLLPYESCNLTSIVLSNHVKDGEIDWEDLRKSVQLGVRFLDNMIEINNYPIPAIERMVRLGNRRVGLGVMGLAHLYFKLGILYNSERAVSLSEKLAKFIRKEADKETEKLGKMRGNFPNYDVSVYAETGRPRRNCATTMIAPTGTISLFADCSSGIEPVFALKTLRKTFFEGDKKNKPTREMLIEDPVYKQFKGKYDSKVFVTSHEIDWQWHVRIQAAWQKYFDNSVSKTINFRNTASVEEVKRAYKLAYKLGCKGITIYRDGSKEDQVLNVSSIGEKVCPDCGANLEIKEGCESCTECGFSGCGV